MRKCSMRQCSLELFLGIHGDTSGTHVDQENETSNNGKGLEKVIFEEITLRVLVMNAPPVVNEYVEDGEEDDQESSRPFRLESKDNHDTSRQTNEGKCETNKRPLSLESNSNEKEDEKYTSGQLEVFPPVVITQARQSCKVVLALNHGFRKDHEKSANDGEVAQEEIDVKDETISKSLKYNDS